MNFFRIFYVSMITATLACPTHGATSDDRMVKNILELKSLEDALPSSEIPQETDSSSDLTSHEEAELDPDFDIPIAPNPHNVAVLQCLDKITARVFTIDARINQEVTFGALKITPRFCHTNPPEELPEAVAFLEITEHRKEEGAQDLFSGWMFASSPSVSALEHPIYDVVVKGCKHPQSSTSAPSRLNITPSATTQAAP